MFGTAANAAAQFDTPLKTEIAQTDPTTRFRCQIYRGFMVQADVSNGGSSSYDVVDYVKKPPACGAEEADGGDLGTWHQARAKGVFIVLSDGPEPDRLMHFMVFDTRAWRTVFDGYGDGDFLSVRSEGNGVALKFRHGYRSNCSVYYGTATACWSTTRAATGLAEDAWEACRQAYDKRSATVRHGRDPKERSVLLSYVAELHLGLSAPRIRPLPGRVTCKVG